MPDLATQLRTYFDEVDPPFVLDELLSPMEAPKRAVDDVTVFDPATAPRPRLGGSPRAGWAVALAALVITLVALGSTLVWWNLRETELVDEPTTTTLPESTVTTVALPPPPPDQSPVPPTGYAAIPIDTEGIVGRSPALVIAPDGAPVMAYLGQRDINVAVCADSGCTELAAVATVAEAGGSVSNLVGPSLALLPDGRPAVAYGFSSGNPEAEGETTDLFLAVCADPTCSAWTTTQVATGGPSNNPALALTSQGLPVVAHGTEGTSLVVSVCSDLDCSAVSSTEVDTGAWLSTIAAAPSSPATFLYTMDGPPRLAVCNDDCTEVTTSPVTGMSEYWAPVIGRGTDGPLIVTVDEEQGAEGSDDGEPPGDVVLITCNDGLCATSESVVVATAVTGVHLRSVAVDGSGNPLITFTDTEGLAILRCADPACAGQPMLGRPASARGDAALALGADDLPLIATYTGSDLVLVRCGDPLCAEGPPPEPVPPSLAFTAPDWIREVAASDVMDWPPPTMATGPRGKTVIIHDAPTGSYGSEGEILSGFAATTCEDDTCTGATTTNAASIDLGWGGTKTIDATGVPISAFWSWDDGSNLGFMRCDDAGCTSHSRRELFEADAWAEPQIAIASSGRPVMAFQNYTFNPGPIQIGFCDDQDCTAFEVVDTDFDCVDSSCERFWIHNTVSLALTADDRPVVAYTPSSGRLRLVTCHDDRCSDHTAVTVDDTGGENEAATVAIGNDGKPVVGYYADGTAHIAFCLDTNCTQIHTAELGTAIPDPWTAPRVTVLDDGRVAVAYSAATDSPRLAVCAYPCDDPTVWVLGDVTGNYTIATAPNGQLMVVWIDGAESLDEPPYSSPGRLVVATCTDPDCLNG